MITINFTNEPNFDEIAKAGITMICDKDMNLQISEDDYKRLEDEFEAAYMDSYIVKDDVHSLTSPESRRERMPPASTC